MYEVFNVVSDEARVKSRLFGENGVLKRYQGLTFWTPNVNIFRDPVMQWGNYNGIPAHTVTLLEAVRAKLPEGQVMYEPGCFPFPAGW